jgi:hypothetical protein
MRRVDVDGINTFNRFVPTSLYFERGHEPPFIEIESVDFIACSSCISITRWEVIGERTAVPRDTSTIMKSRLRMQFE